MNPKKSKRLNWDDALIIKLIDLWGEKLHELKSVKRNAHTYEDIAALLKTNNFVVCGKDVHIKIQNLTQRYRSEKKMMGPSGGSPSSWKYFDAVHQVIGALKYNDQSLVNESNEDDGMIFPDTPPLAALEEVFSESSSTTTESTFPSGELSAVPSSSSSPGRIHDIPGCSTSIPGCSTSTPKSKVPAKKRKTDNISEQMTKLMEIIESESETHKLFVQKSLENDEKIVSAINDLVSALKR